MTGKIVCIANRKGGVGKTTASVLLAQTLQDQLDKSVVVVDVDPQASATLALAGEEFLERLEPHYLEKVLASTDPITRKGRIVAGVWGQISALTRRPDVPLALAPCSPELWRLEEQISTAKIQLTLPGFVKRFNAFLRALKARYEVVIIDTPPGVSALGRAALRSADLIVAPCEVSRVAVRGMRVFTQHLQSEKRYDRAFILWTKHKEPQDFENAKALLNELHQRNGNKPPILKSLLDVSSAANAQGLLRSNAFVNGILRTDAHSFDSAYRTPSGENARAFAKAVLQRLGMEQQP